MIHLRAALCFVKCMHLCLTSSDCVLVVFSSKKKNLIIHLEGLLRRFSQFYGVQGVISVFTGLSLLQIIVKVNNCCKIKAEDNE